MARYGHAASEEIRQMLLARDDLQCAVETLAPGAAKGVIEAFMNAMDRLIECKLAERRLY